jgi:hypothetical protein
MPGYDTYRPLIPHGSKAGLPGKTPALLKCCFQDCFDLTS